MRGNYMQHPNAEFQQRNFQNMKPNSNNGPWNGGHGVPNGQPYINPDFGNPNLMNPYLNDGPQMIEPFIPKSQHQQQLNHNLPFNQNNPNPTWDDQQKDSEEIPSFTFNKGAANVPMHLSGPDQYADLGFKSGPPNMWNNKGRNGPMNVGPIQGGNPWNMNEAPIDPNGWNRPPMAIPINNGPMNGPVHPNNWNNMSRGGHNQGNGGGNNYRGQKNNMMGNMDGGNQMKYNNNFNQMRGSEINHRGGQINPSFNNGQGVMWNNQNMNSQYVNHRLPLNPPDMPMQRQSNNQQPPMNNPSHGPLSTMNVNNTRNMNSPMENRSLKHDATTNNVPVSLNNNPIQQHNNANTGAPVEPAGGNVFAQATEDSYWRDPNSDIKKFQRDTGTGVWGDPENINAKPIQRWGVKLLPDLVDTDDINQVEKENGVKYIVARGWGEEVTCSSSSGLNSPQLKSGNSVGSPLYSTKDGINRWSPDEGASEKPTSRIPLFEPIPTNEIEEPASSGRFIRVDGSDWQSGDTPNNQFMPFSAKDTNDVWAKVNDQHHKQQFMQQNSSIEALQLSPEVYRIAMNKQYLDPSFNGQKDRKSTIIYNQLITLIQQTLQIEAQIDQFRKNNENHFAAENSETQSQHNMLIVKVAKAKTDIFKYRDLLFSRMNNCPNAMSADLPVGSLLHTISQEMAYKGTNTDAFLNETLTNHGQNFTMENAPAVVNRSLANLDLSGNDSPSDMSFSDRNQGIW
uniref:Protein Gawky n=1 Tax=Rhabditophanes sp. KR3021 TaxID=114890 RepID=A0AC35U1V7_9BILA